MVTRFAKLGVALCVFVSLLLPTAQAKPVEDYKWFEVRTEHFTVRGIVGKRQTVKIARHLEMMRGVIPESLLAFRRGPSEPEVIYFFKETEQLAEVGYTGDSRAKIDFDNGRFMIMGPGTYVSAEHYAMWMYATFLAIDGEYDRRSNWVARALYTYFATARISDGRFRYGGQRGRKSSNPSVIQAQVDLTFDSVRYGDLSYSRKVQAGGGAWFIFRFLTRTHADWVDIGNRLAEYRSLLEGGSDVDAAFASAFGVAIEELGQAMFDFSANCCSEYTIDIDELLPEFEPEVRKMTREEISLGLADIAANLGDEKRAAQLREIALDAE